MTEESPDDFLAAHRSQKRSMIAVSIMVALVVTGGIVWFIATRKPTPKRPPPDAEVHRDLEAEYIANRRRQAFEEIGTACDEDLANHALKDLAKEDDWDGVVIVGNSWLARCPADEEVRWKLFRALEELERWPDAVAEATRLIAMKATDVDYWWWRGKARKESGDVVGAAFDYRQSIALAEMESSRGINIMGYGDVAPSVGRACEAAFAMRWWGHRNGGGVSDEGTRKLASLSTFGKCEGAIGRGQGRVTLATPQETKVGTTTVSARIDLHVPYVVIDEATATAAGLDLAAAEAIEVVLDGKAAPARLIRTNVTVGDLAADGVEVAVIADALPVLGLGFWWRFDWAPSDDGGAAVSAMADPSAL